MKTTVNIIRRKHACIIYTCLILFLSALPAISRAQGTGAEVQALDADTLYFSDEYGFRDFLQFHNLKEYSIKPQVDFFDCTVNPGTMIYPEHESDDFLHEERFFGLPFVFIIDHNGTRKIYDLLIPSYEDSTITTCDVRLTLYDSIHDQHIVFYDIFNWIDENGRNIFNMNKKLYFLYGYNSGDYDFPGEMIQVTTGIDFTFPDYFPEDQGPINVVFTLIDMYTQYHYYEDGDEDGYGNPDTDTLDYLAPTGFITTSGDCDDGNSLVYPGAVEICNGLDDNCDGLIDEDFSMLTLEASSSVICVGDTAYFTTDALDGYTYVWYRDGELVDTAGTNSYAATESGNYYVTAIGPDDCLLASASMTLDMFPSSPVNVFIGGDADLCTAPGVGLVKLKTTASPSSTVEWYKDGVLIAGATSRSYVATETGDYHSRVTNINGCSLSSDPVTVFNSCRLTSGVRITDDWSISPNPTNGSLNIRGEVDAHLSDEVCIEIHSFNGALLQRQVFGAENGQFQCTLKLENEMVNGCYYLTVRAGEETFEKLIILQR